MTMTIEPVSTIILVICKKLIPLVSMSETNTIGHYTAGDARRYAHWDYLGSSFGLADYGNHYYHSGNRVDDSLVAGQVTG